MRRVIPAAIAALCAGFVAQAAHGGPFPDVVIDSAKGGNSNGLSYRSATFRAVGAGASAYAVAKCPKRKVLAGGGGLATRPAQDARFLELGPNRIESIPTKARKSFTAE